MLEKRGRDVNQLAHTIVEGDRFSHVLMVQYNFPSQSRIQDMIDVFRPDFAASQVLAKGTILA